MPIVLATIEGATQELLDGEVLEAGKRLYVTWPDYIIESHDVKLELEEGEKGYRRACVAINYHGHYVLIPLAILSKEKGVRVSWSGWR